MTIYFAIIGHVCLKGQVYSDCVSSCPPNCASPQPPGPAAALGQCREECVGGCECPPGLYLYQDNCLKRDDCPCFYRRRTYQSGDRIQQRCNIWYNCCSLVYEYFAFTYPYQFHPFFLFSHILVCAEQDSGSALERNVQCTAA